jgi:hypothetical protein
MRKSAIARKAGRMKTKGFTRSSHLSGNISVSLLSA